MLNTIIMQGRLTKAPEIRTKNDKALALFSIACNRGKDDGPVYMNCKAFGKTAEVINKHFTKGSEIILTGSIDTYKKEKVTYYYILVQSFEFCGAAKKNEESTSADAQDDDIPF